MKTIIRYIVVSSEYMAHRAIFLTFGYFLLFNFVEAGIERIIWGEPRFHVLDYLFIAVFVGIAHASAYVCYLHNKAKERIDNG